MHRRFLASGVYNQSIAHICLQRDLSNFKLNSKQISNTAKIEIFCHKKLSLVMVKHK